MRLSGTYERQNGISRSHSVGVHALEKHLQWTFSQKGMFFALPINHVRSWSSVALAYAEHIAFYKHITSYI